MKVAITTIWPQLLESRLTPYGIDYPTHQATGRFSNGLNMPDIISEYLGAEPTLPYLSPDLRGEKLLIGANFASAGIGILNDTGIQFRLYELGARRVIVTGTGPLGCVPSEIARSRNGECNPDLLQAGDLFNPQLVTILNELNTQYGSDVFVAANAFKMHSDFLSNPQAFGKTFQKFGNNYSMINIDIQSHKFVHRF
ncbi:hypothetical protein J5N97_001532 [Dioscorea zingiberensis]|uniref:Uncharacterized protein n=1 Tax=Dioscorea zingiberensis TaxID=325984 RepID=A0A9D5H361_9LILI|nr:hypothetical protein J5N97_001532 [Dioscorea zingiberensis]